MRLHISVLLCLIMASSAMSQQYSRVKVFTGADGLIELAKAGVAIDHVVIKKGEYIISDFSDTEILLIRQTGLDYEILISDVQDHYLKQNQLHDSGDEPPDIPSRSNSCAPIPAYPIPANFSLGSMGGYFT